MVAIREEAVTTTQEQLRSIRHDALNRISMIKLVLTMLEDRVSPEDRSQLLIASIGLDELKDLLDEVQKLTGKH